MQDDLFVTTFVYIVLLLYLTETFGVVSLIAVQLLLYLYSKLICIGQVYTKYISCVKHWYTYKCELYP